MIRGQPQRLCRVSSAATALALSLPLLLATLRGGSSFILPAVITGGPASSSSSRPLSRRIWAAAENSDAKEAIPPQSADIDSSASEKEVDDGQPKSPAGLTLEGVYRRLKLETQGLADGVVGLESKDTDYGVEVVKVKMLREPSLGMQLEEVARGGDGRGLVLVAGTEPGGNAEATGKIFMGDTLCWAGVEPDGMTKVEALDWDQTVGILGDLAGETEIVLIVKRLVKRETINVQFDLPGGNRDIGIKAGSNLRGEMMRLDVPVYDPNTMRFDQPYATGNCAGEGTCGTCFVEVQQGEELITPPDREELMLLSKGNLPVRWRLSCKMIVGIENKPGTVRVKAVPQAAWREQRSSSSSK